MTVILSYVTIDVSLHTHLHSGRAITENRTMIQVLTLTGRENVERIKSLLQAAFPSFSIQPGSRKSVVRGTIPRSNSGGLDSCHVQNLYRNRVTGICYSYQYLTIHKYLSTLIDF